MYEYQIVGNVAAIHEVKFGELYVVTVAQNWQTEKKEGTYYFPMLVSGSNATFTQKYLEVGDKVAATGKLSNQERTLQDGTKLTLLGLRCRWLNALESKAAKALRQKQVKKTPSAKQAPTPAEIQAYIDAKEAQAELLQPTNPGSLKNK